MNGRSPMMATRNPLDSKPEAPQGFTRVLDQVRLFLGFFSNFHRLTVWIQNGRVPLSQRIAFSGIPLGSISPIQIFQSQHNQIKPSGNVQKLDVEKIQSYLDEYNKASLIYRDEEFSQQADSFLTKIACDKKSKQTFFILPGIILMCLPLNSP